MSFEFPVALIFKSDIEAFEECLDAIPHGYAKQFVTFLNLLIARRNEDLAFPRDPARRDEQTDGTAFLDWFEARMLEPQPDPTTKH